jgi:short-subunit dehydrogenase
LTRGTVVPNSKTALVTGACSGIGIALARQLAARGYRLVLVSQRAEPLARAAREIDAAHRVETLPLVLDLARRDAAAELEQELRRREIEIDVLINNAGMFFFGEAADADPERAANLLELHVVTPSLLVTYFAPGMRARGSGHMLFVSSISAFKDFPGISYYGASKKYLLGFSRALRSELGLHGVTVTCLAPGPVDTALYDTDKVPVQLARRFGIMMAPERVAREALDALFRGDALCIPGRVVRILTRATRLLPQPLIDLVRARAPWLTRRT